MRTIDRRRIVKERQRTRTPEEQQGLNRLLSDLRILREQAINNISETTE